MFLFNQSCSNVNKQYMGSNQNQLCYNKIIKNWEKNKRQQSFTQRSYDVQRGQARGKTSPKKHRGQKISLKQMKQKPSTHKNTNNRTAADHYQVQKSHHLLMNKNSKQNKNYNQAKTNQDTSYVQSTQNKQSYPACSETYQENKIIKPQLLLDTRNIYPTENKRVNVHDNQRKYLKESISFHLKQFLQSNHKLKSKLSNQELPLNYKLPQNYLLNRQISKPKIISSREKNQSTCLRISFNGKQYLSGLSKTQKTIRPISSQSKTQFNCHNFRYSAKIHPIYNLSSMPMIQKPTKIIIAQRINPQVQKNKCLYNSQNIGKRAKTQQPDNTGFMFQSYFNNKQKQTLKKHDKKDNITQKKNKVIKKQSFRKPFPDLSQVPTIHKKQSNNQIFRPFPTKQANEKIKQYEPTAFMQRLNTNNSDIEAVISFTNDGNNSQMRPPLLEAKLALSQVDANSDYSENSIVLYEMTKDNKFSQILQNKHCKTQEVNDDKNFLHVNYNFNGGPAFMTSLCGNDTDRSEVSSKISFGKGKAYSRKSENQMHIDASFSMIPTEIPYNSMQLSPYLNNINFVGQLAQSIVKQQ